MLGQYNTIIFSHQKAPKAQANFSACKAHAEVRAKAMAFLCIVLAMQIKTVYKIVAMQ